MNVKQIAGVATLVVAVTAALAVFGLDPPKIATQSHVAAVAAEHKVDYDRLAGEVKTLEQRSLEQAISSGEIRAGDLRMLAEDREAAGKKAASVRRQVQRIERQNRQFEKELEALLTK